MKKFCERRIFELPLPASGMGALSLRQEKFVVKLNVREDISLVKRFARSVL